MTNITTEAENERLRAERDKLQAFKDWTHAYLDSKGVPHHPPGTHGAEGCRIGDRMDWVWAELEQLRTQIAGHCDRIAAQSELLTQRALKVCGKWGCNKPATQQVEGCLLYGACDEHAPEIRDRVAKES